MLGNQLDFFFEALFYQNVHRQLKISLGSSNPTVFTMQQFHLGSRILGFRTLRKPSNLRCQAWESQPQRIPKKGAGRRAAHPLCGRRPEAASFMETCFRKGNHRKLLGFPKAPATQGPGNQKLLHSNEAGVPGP